MNTCIDIWTALAGGDLTVLPEALGVLAPGLLAGLVPGAGLLLGARSILRRKEAVNELLLDSFGQAVESLDRTFKRGSGHVDPVGVVKAVVQDQARRKGAEVERELRRAVAKRGGSAFKKLGRDIPSRSEELIRLLQRIDPGPGPNEDAGR